MKHNERMDSISRQDLKRARGDFNTFSDKIQDMDDKTAGNASQLSDLANEVNDKASQADIDAIAEANAEAEAVDARTGANGVVYSTYGEGIRDQISLVAGPNSGITTVDGGTINLTGVMGSYAAYKRTDIFELLEGETVVIRTALNNPTNISALYKYDESYQPIGRIYTADGSGQYVYTASEEVEYLAACGLLSDLIVYTLKVSSEGLVQVRERIKSIENINTQVELDLLKQGGVNDGALSKKKLNSFTAEERFLGKSCDELTAFVDSTFYSGYTNRFAAPEFLSKIEADIRASGNCTITAVLVVGKSQSEIYNAIGSGNMTVEEIIDFGDIVSTAEYTGYDGARTTQTLSFDFGDFPTNKKMCYLFMFTDGTINLSYKQSVLRSPETDLYDEYLNEYDDDNFGAYRSSTGEYFGFLTNVTNSKNFSNDIRVYESKYTDFEEALRNVSRNEYLVKMFDKSIHVGDSLTVGAIDSATSEAINYPKFFKRMTGWSTVDRIAFSGYSASQMWDYFESNNPDFSDYECVFIFLGTNLGLTDTLDEDTASQPYAETQTGDYCRIVEYIQNSNANAKIFLLGITYGQKYGANDVIKDIAIKYDIAFLELFYNGYIELREEKYHPNDDPVHFGKIGYTALAKVIYNALVEELAENYDRYEVTYA